MANDTEVSSLILKIKQTVKIQTASGGAWSFLDFEEFLRQCGLEGSVVHEVKRKFFLNEQNF